MKYILLIGDGMGGTPLDGLGGRTALEAASTPAMDRIAVCGEPMLVQTVPEGYPPGSDVANLSLLGYEPERYYTGRAPLEAASMGVALQPEEIAFRCNLVTLEWTDDGRVTMVDYSAGHLTTPEAHNLIGTLQECGTSQLRLYPGISYRHLLVCREAVSMVTAPPHDWTGQDVTEYYNAYMQVEPLATFFRCARSLLADHPVNQQRLARGKRPANSIWLWGEGRSPSMESLSSRYGIQGSLVSAVDLLKGIGVCLGMQVLHVPGATGYLDTDYGGKVAAALESLADVDLAVIHVEAPDEAGHQGDVAAKVQAIEDFDQRIVAPIVRALEEQGEPFRLAVTMDHYTPVVRRTHEGWPVPVVLYDSRCSHHAGARSFTETEIRDAADSRPVSGPVFFSRLLNGKGHAG